MLENEQEAMKKSYGSVFLEMKITAIQTDQISEHSTINDDLILERDSLREENQIFKSALDQWSKRFEEIRIQNEQLTQYELFSSILLIQISILLES
jgi:hypothetical protein